MKSLNSWTYHLLFHNRVSYNQ